jgi:hypothetical protein
MPEEYQEGQNVFSNAFGYVGLKSGAMGGTEIVK